MPHAAVRVSGAQPTPVSDGSDPVARGLVIALLGVVALFLVAVAAAIVLGFLRPAQAPRTLAERDLANYGYDVARGTADAEEWGTYIGLLIDSGQYDKAESTLTRALRTAEGGRSHLLLQQARLQYSRREFEASLDSCAETIAAAESELGARMEALRIKGITGKTDVERPASLAPALHLKADALAELGRNAEAIEAYDAYLAVSPTDADILVTRGRLRAAAGDRTGAKADFDNALRFIPDYPPALEELKRMGGESQ